MSTYQPTNSGDNSGSESRGSNPPSTPSTNPTTTTNTPDTTNNATTLRVLTSTNNPTLPSTSTSTNPSSSTTTPTTTTTSTTTAVSNKYGFKIPKMGRVVESVKGTFYPCTGGKPKFNWSSINVPSSIPSPNQIRPVYVGDAQKAYRYRQTGCAIKFKQGDSLQEFEKKVNKHLVDYGMDTIAYIPDVGSTNMVNIVKEHTRFTEEYVRDQAALYEKFYDDYDKSNSAAAREALLNSLDKPIAQDIERLLEEEDGFLVAWITFVREIQSLSSDRFDGLKERIRSMNATDYPQQNIKMMADAYERAAKELESAGQYDHNLTKCMINGFIAAGGNSNEDWKAPLRKIKESIDKALVKLGFHRTKENENDFMKCQKLTYKHICHEARRRYKTKVESKQWPPSMTATVMKRIPRQCRADILPVQMDKLPNDLKKKKQVTCHLCGRPGHIKPKCPLLKLSTRSTSDETIKENKSRSSKNLKLSFKVIPPKDGETEILVRNGKTFYWCARCKRWTTTHSTATHEVKKCRESKNGEFREKCKESKNREFRASRFEANLAMVDFELWSKECGNHSTSTWTKLCQNVWTGVCVGTMTSIASVIYQQTMRYACYSFTSYYVEAPSALRCISRIIGSIMTITIVMKCLFTVEDFRSLAPLLWLMVACIAIKSSPSRIVEYVKVVKARRSQLCMTEYISPRYRQGRLSKYYKSDKKQTEKKCQFNTCDVSPLGNVNRCIGAQE